jgi:PIN domain nuclease of toxin-antitoxin system
MRLLLDTHTFLWFVANDPKLSARAKVLIGDPANRIEISPASYWEIAIKVSLGKLSLHAPYPAFMQRAIAGNRFTVLAVEPQHTAALIGLPFHHRDPFDRLLICQALVEQIPVVSADSTFDLYQVSRHW